MTHKERVKVGIIGSQFEADIQIRGCFLRSKIE